MPCVRIERIPVRLFNLGFFGFDHLLLTYQQSETGASPLQDDWYVIEGVRDTTRAESVLGVDGADGRTSLSAANGGLTGRELESEIGTPADRCSSVLLTGLAAFDAWQTMAAHAAEIAAQGLPYNALGFPGGAMPTLNSSSVVASLLAYAGLDIEQSLPAGLRRSPGTMTLIGTALGAKLELRGQFTAIVGVRDPARAGRTVRVNPVANDNASIVPCDRRPLRRPARGSQARRRLPGDRRRPDRRR